MATLTNIDKVSTAVGNADKVPTTLSGSDKSPAALGNSIKDKEKSFLEREALGYILLESGGKIVLVDHDFSNTTKAPALLTNITKS